jgi:cell division protein FtsL
MDSLLIKISLLDMILKMENGTKSKLMEKNFLKQNVAKFSVIEKMIICIFLVGLQTTLKTLERLMTSSQLFGT